MSNEKARVSLECESAIASHYLFALCLFFKQVIGFRSVGGHHFTNRIPVKHTSKRFPFFPCACVLWCGTSPGGWFWSCHLAIVFSAPGPCPSLSSAHVPSLTFFLFLFLSSTFSLVFPSVNKQAVVIAMVITFRSQLFLWGLDCVACWKS